MNTEQMADVAARAAVHAALADPARLLITDTLAAGDASPSDLAAMLAMPSNLLAHHLHVLEQAGLLTRRRSEGDRRRSYLRLVPGALDSLSHPTSRRARRVLFVCTANSARSHLAAALWRRASRVRRHQPEAARRRRSRRARSRPRDVITCRCAASSRGISAGYARTATWSSRYATGPVRNSARWRRCTGQSPTRYQPATPIASTRPWLSWTAHKPGRHRQRDRAPSVGGAGGVIPAHSGNASPAVPRHRCEGRHQADRPYRPGGGVLGMMKFGAKTAFALDAQLNPDKALIEAFVRANGAEPFLIFGFTFLVWDKLYRAFADGELDLANAILIHSGGWKKLEAQKVSNAEFRLALKRRFNLSNIFTSMASSSRSAPSSSRGRTDCSILPTSPTSSCGGRIAGRRQRSARRV